MSLMRNIRVVPYDPAWVEAFQIEAARLSAIFGETLLSIHHIGSTSVPGLAAKPVIDIMPVVRDINDLEQFYPALIALGYEPLGENGIPGRRYFIKGGEERRSHNVHTYQPDHPEVTSHLNFRNYLRAHPETAREYAILKAGLARQFPNDIEGYIEGKAAFVREIIRKAGEESGGARGKGAGEPGRKNQRPPLPTLEPGLKFNDADGRGHEGKPRQ